MQKKNNNYSPIFLSVVLQLFLQLSFAQQNKIDSLQNLLKTSRQDTNKVSLLNDLAWEFRNNNPDTSIILSNQALLLANSLKNITQQWKQIATGNCLNQLGEFNWRMGDYPKALNYYFKAIAIWEELEKDPSLSKTFILKCKSPTLSNIGIVYRNQGNYSSALNYYFKALKNFEVLNDKNKISSIIGNIGSVYYNQANYEKALEYYFKTFKTFEELNDKNKMAVLIGNIGLVYKAQGSNTKALDYYFKALKMAQELEDENGISRHLDNIGSVYVDQNDYAKGEDYYLQALKKNKELGNKSNMAINLGNIGVLYVKQGKFKEAEEYLQKGNILSKEIGDIEGLKLNHQNLSSLYDKRGKYKLAFENYQLYIAYNDTLQNDENTKKQTQIEMQYEFDKIQMADSIKNTENIKQGNLIHEQKIKQQKAYTYGGVIGFLLMVVVAAISYRAFKQKQKSSEIILFQKNLVEEKQKEILDSIHYAKRIQKSLLPTEKYIERNLKKHY